jgi:hypothetical protein
VTVHKGILYSNLLLTWLLYRYAVRESTSRVKIFKNFKERSGLLPKLNYSAEGIHGGHLLCARSNEFLTFYDWETGSPVRRIEAEAKNVSLVIFTDLLLTTYH